MPPEIANCAIPILHAKCFKCFLPPGNCNKFSWLLRFVCTNKNTTVGLL